MISKFSVRKPYTVLVGVVLVIVLGVVSLSNMTTDLLPDMSFPYVLIITTDVGASPEEVEEDVTAPIESAMATTSNINNVTSMSYNSYSIVVCEYEQDTDMDSIIIEIDEELDLIESSFPSTAGSPIIMQIDPDMMPVMVAAVDMDDMTEIEISDYVDSELLAQLESVEGVASVTATGLATEEIIVTLDQDKIDALNDRIQEAIEGEFDDAQETIDEAKDEIESGQSELDESTDALSDAMDEAVSQRETLYETEDDLEAQLSELEAQRDALTEIQSALNEFMESDEYAQLAELSSGIAELEETIEASGAYLDETTLATLNAQLSAYQASLDAANAEIASQFSALSSLGISVSTYEDLPAAAASISETLVTVNTAIATIEEALEQVRDGQTTLSDAIDELNNSTALAAITIGSTSAELSAALSSLEEAQSELDETKESASDSADLSGILTLDTVASLLAAQNFDMPAGYASDDEGNSFLVSVGDDFSDVDDLYEVALMSIDVGDVGTIYLSDVATIEVVDDADETYAVVNGNPGILLSIEKQTGYSTGDVTDAAIEKMESLEEENEGLHLSVLMDQGVYIDIIVESVVQNIIFGALLAIIVLFLFLKDVRPTIIIAVSIPISVIFAIVLMYFTDVSLNIISLSGLALGIGMLVDNSIVVIENIYRLRSEGMSIRKAAVSGASQVTGAIVASTLTTVSVFAPIIFLEGITRQLFVDMALTIAFTLLASLVIALTVVPAASSKMLKKSEMKPHPWFDKFTELYVRFLKKCLRFKPVVFILAVVILVASFAGVMSKGMTFLDMDVEADQAIITVSANEDETLTEDELIELSDEIVSRLCEMDDIETVGAMLGSGTMLSSLSSDADASVMMYIVFAEDSKYSTDELTDQIIEATSDLDCLVEATSSMTDYSSYFGDGISVQIEGSDMETLQSLAAEVAGILENTEGTEDVEDGLDNLTNEFVITVDKEKAAQYNYTVAQVYQLVYEQMADAESATTIATDLKDYEVYLQTEAQSELTLDDIKEITFTYTNSDDEEEEIPISEICEFEETETLSTIYRDSQSRYIEVSCAVDDDYNVTLLSSDIQDQIDEIDIPEGYSITMTGEDSTIMDAMEQLVLMLVLAVIFIYLIMVAQFQSLLSPFIIMFTIPLAFTGGFLALLVTGNELGVISMLGLIMLSGIIVNNGIVLIDYINQMRAEGMSKKEAILDAGRKRIRPVLMTALTTILAMSTMALGLGEGSQMMRPMAITVIGGLIYGTLLTLIVVPCIYDAFNREKNMVEEEL